MEDIKQMDYIERCIKETLRIFPPVTIMGRTIREELQLSTFILMFTKKSNIFSII